MTSSSRREFLLGASACSLAHLTAKGESSPTIDPNRVVVAADIHIPLPWSQQKYRTGREYPWIIEAVQRHIAEILTLRPLPAHFLALGDLSLAFGEEREYEILREVLKPLYDRGIKVTLAMGNHDIRASFAKSFPEEAARSLVPGRYVYRVETPHADFLILDTLKEPSVRGDYRALTSHDLGKDQALWAKEELKRLAKPTFVCAHHPFNESGLAREIVRTPMVKGYLHGHNHAWQLLSAIENYNTNALTLRTVGIGSFGIDRYVGYSVFDLTPEKATMSILSKDYYFPTKRAKNERPPLWDELAKDFCGRKVVFPLI